MPELQAQQGFVDHPDRRPAVVAGASAGIGAAVARTLGASGHPVALGARRVERCEEVVEQIRAAGGEAMAFPLDVSDTASVTAFAKAATEAFGEIDVVVANAGQMLPRMVADLSADELADTLNTNVLGLQRLVAEFVPSMVSRRRGDLVVVSSEVVDQPRPGVGGYVASKWAVEGLTRTLQMEMEGTGVRVSLVRPGPTASEIATGWDMSDAMRVVELGQKFGSLRHFGYLHPEAIARTIGHVVSAPKGVHIALSYVTPEAPVQHAPAPNEERTD